MNCEKCGRNLRENSRYCDFCGSAVRQVTSEQNTSEKFNEKALLSGIITSVLLTLIISIIAKIIGLPLFFGALILPFFWRKNKK